MKRRKQKKVIKKTEDIENKEDKIYLNSNINEVFASTELIQYFKNPLDSPIELQIQFPIKENINLSKFEITIKNKTIISKILSKEKAEEKYSDAIAQGSTAIMSNYSKSFKSYNVNIGNLAPKESLCLKTIYNQPILSYDMSYQYIIMKDFPSFVIDNKDEDEEEEEEENDKKISPNIIVSININTFSKITRLITNFENKENLTISYNKDYTEAKINNTIIDIKKKYSIDLHILFRTKDINKPNLFYQYNPILKKHCYCLDYIYSSEDIEKLIKIPKKPDEDDKISYFTKYQSNSLNEEPSLFIFLVDQSGSMYGEAIQLVIKSLLIFIQSLPQKSYFQFIGFGSDFKKYNELPVEYNNKNIEKIKKIIKELNSDLGGTNIVSPLEYIFSNKSEYQKINLSKNILLLTDGEVNDKNKCFDLIKENSNIFRIHSIGIGNNYDKELIKLCGKYGNGSFNFVKNINNINDVIIKILNNCLRPYLYDINFSCLNLNKKSLIPIFVKSNNYAYQDEIINYSFILDDKQNKSYIDSQKNKYKFKMEFIKNLENFEKNFEFKNLLNLPDGDNLSKIIIDKYFKNNLDLDEKKEIKLAKEYEVLSKNTSLYAEISNEESQKKQLIQIKVLSKQNKIRYFNLSSFGSARMSYGNKAARMSTSCFYNFSGLKRKRVYSDSDSDDNNDNESEEENVVNENETKEDVDIIELITNQDPIYGFWNKNKETLKIEQLLDKNVINNINKVCLKLKDKKKIYYTILVIYFIFKNYKNKVSEYRFVLNKAKSYLKKEGIDYDKISSKIIK